MLLIGGGFLMCVRLQTSNLKVTTMFETYNVKNAQAKSINFRVFLTRVADICSALKEEANEHD